MVKVYWLGVFILLLLIAGYSGVRIRGELVGDPPSVYNNMPGGLTIFASSEAVERRVDIIYSLDDIYRYDPGKYTLLIVGPDTRVDTSPRLRQWIEDGGLLIVMDETMNTEELLRGFDIYLESTPAIQEIATGVCSAGNANIRVVFNVYTVVYSTSNHTVLCRVNDKTTGLSRSIGRGMVIAIGDSSLVINEVLSKGGAWYGNRLFIDMVSNGRDLVVYEGGRTYTYSSTSVITQYIRGLILLASDASESILYIRNPLLKLLAVLTIILAILTVVLLKLGLSISHSRLPRR
ncbi:DUF4350 domain-containing protein [Desulfurococcus amylolyticus]|uniref:DUF4350 domain-containing protein n=1 Tax=Desulfurococcus amylolyticus DSM 16532 TaxID=768672 RepID=I3XRK1_DESAM|nr:DUF4350 domain-containing protein [Desulfurococcus amylolyticus]AFL66575.1 hypothetical protein Desfe_0675 [Desulfurococcus amylolyticus DSM 16532]